MSVRLVIALIAMSFALPLNLAAQGIFEGLAFPKSVITTGHTEVLGSVHISLRNGTTESGTLIIDVSPLKVTNAAPSDIQVTASGNLTTGPVTIDSELSQVRVPINPGGNSGSIRIDGIRASFAGSNITSLTARLSMRGLNVLSSGNSVVLVNNVVSGLEVDAMTDRFLIFNNQVIDNTATIVLREGSITSFVSEAPYGQNTPTQLRIRITDLPAGLEMHFPASVVSPESGAILTTAEGTTVDLPRPNGNSDVFYVFSGVSTSPDQRETFQIPFTVAAAGITEALQPTIDVSLAPIGAAVPSTSLPSTLIPRFAEENLTVLEGSSKLPKRTFHWIGIDNTLTNRLFLFNASTRAANLTLSAYDSGGHLVTGTDVTNPVRQSLPVNQSTDQLLKDIFGPAATNIATVLVQSTETDIIPLGTSSNSNVSESTPLPDRGLANIVLPAIVDNARVYLLNPGSTKVSGTLTLRTPQGAPVSSLSLDIDALATISKSVRELFGTQMAGQISGSFQSGVIASTSFGTETTLNIVPAQTPVGLPSLYVPFFASGDGYETDIHLINASEESFTLTAHLVDSLGTPGGPARPITVSPGEQLTATISQLFQIQSFTSGYVRLDMPVIRRAFWTFYPAVSGHVRVRFGQSSSTTIPISGYPLEDSFIPASGISDELFQGIVLVNPNAAPITATLQAVSDAGVLLNSIAMQLAAGQIVSRLTGELFNVPIPEGSIIRVTGTMPLITTSVTGTLSGDGLRSVAGLR